MTNTNKLSETVNFFCDKQNDVDLKNIIYNIRPMQINTGVIGFNKLKDSIVGFKNTNIEGLGTSRVGSPLFVNEGLEKEYKLIYSQKLIGFFSVPTGPTTYDDVPVCLFDDNDYKDKIFAIPPLDKGLPHMIVLKNIEKE